MNATRHPDTQNVTHSALQM